MSNDLYLACLPSSHHNLKWDCGSKSPMSWKRSYLQRPSKHLPTMPLRLLPICQLTLLRHRENLIEYLLPRRRRPHRRHNRVVRLLQRPQQHQQRLWTRTKCTAAKKHENARIWREDWRATDRGAIWCWACCYAVAPCWCAACGVSFAQPLLKLVPINCCIL